MSEQWLIPYADILTLLLALFVILFSMSAIDAKKFIVLSNAFNQMFTGGTGLLQFDTPVPSGDSSGQVVKTPSKKTNQYPAVDPNTGNPNQQNLDKIQKQQEEMQALLSKMNADIKTQNLTNKLQTALTSEGLLVTIRDDVLFDSGSADVRPQDIKTANEISNLLVMNPPRNIIISGHTDNVPIQNSKYASNWELSVMRAVNFMKVILQNNNKLDPKYFSAKGFGEYQPVASNSTPEGRAKNRRVEILISPDIQQ